MFSVLIHAADVVQKLSNRIKKLQESELTLEDMDSEDTNFVLEEKCVINNTCTYTCAIHI